MSRYVLHVTTVAVEMQLSVAYCVCLVVALGTQHVKHMRRTVIPRLTSDPANEFFG